MGGALNFEEKFVVEELKGVKVGKCERSLVLCDTVEVEQLSTQSHSRLLIYPYLSFPV